MHDLTRTARTTGLLYLLLGLTGIGGFLIIRPRLFDAGDPLATVEHLQAHESLAALGVVLELGAVVSQALVALWFYRLFRPVDSFAAGAVAALGMMNGVAILGSAAALGAALQVARDTALAGADPAGAVALLYAVSEQFWAVGNVFFGLWLIPMGLLVLRSAGMPRALGQVLVVGGVGYLLSALVVHLAPSAELLMTLLVVPATIGEVWMIVQLLARGVGAPTRVSVGADTVG